MLQSLGDCLQYGLLFDMTEPPAQEEYMVSNKEVAAKYSSVEEMEDDFM